MFVCAYALQYRHADVFMLRTVDIDLAGEIRIVITVRCKRKRDEDVLHQWHTGGPLGMNA